MRISRNNKILAVAFVVLLFLSYKLAIEKTIDVKKTYQQLSIKKDETKDLPVQRGHLEEQHAYLDAILKTSHFAETSVQNSLLRMLNVEADKNKINVLEFNQPHFHKQGDTQVYTYSMNLSGSYIAILKTIHAIEMQGNFGEVVHVGFEKKINYKTKKPTLQATVLVQQVK